MDKAYRLLWPIKKKSGNQHNWPEMAGKLGISERSLYRKPQALGNLA
jgi:catalase (peroxidase I)